MGSSLRRSYTEIFETLLLSGQSRPRFAVVTVNCQMTACGHTFEERKQEIRKIQDEVSGSKLADTVHP